MKLSILGGALLVLSASPAVAAPLEAYGRLPALDDVRISPDGTTLAYVAAGARGRAIIVQRLADDQLLATVDAKNDRVRGLTWAGSRHLLMQVGSTTPIEEVVGPDREWSTVLDYNLDSKLTRAPMAGVKNALNTVGGVAQAAVIGGVPTAYLVGWRFPSPSEGIVRSRTALFRADLNTSSLTDVDVGVTGTQAWLVDPHGNAVLRADYDQRTGRFAFLGRAARAWRELHAETALVDTPSIDGFGADGKHAIVRAFRSGRTARYALDLQSGDWSPPLDLSDDDVLLRDPINNFTIGRLHVGDSRLKYTFDDPADQKAWDSLERAFAGQSVRLASWSDDRKRLIVEVFGTRDGNAYALVDLRTGKVDWLGDVHPGVSEKDIREVRHFSYAASDGLRIPAYLTLPAGREAKALPLVVLPHGGPEARDFAWFNWMAQALASRGYAVLQPQFRGSTGFGDAHHRAGDGERGRKMQTDLSDGVRYLAQQGTIDAARVCIMGEDYGGYAALMGSVSGEKTYRCAVSIAGASDLQRLSAFGNAKWSANSAAARSWFRTLGVAGANDPKLQAISPVHLASQASAPVLLIHGQDDTVVPYDQSLEMQRALQRAGKPVELVTLKGEDHWLSRGETRLQMLKASVDFLERNNPPR